MGTEELSSAETPGNLVSPVGWRSLSQGGRWRLEASTWAHRWHREDTGRQEARWEPQSPAQRRGRHLGGESGLFLHTSSWSLSPFSKHSSNIDKYSRGEESGASSLRTASLLVRRHQQLSLQTPAIGRALCREPAVTPTLTLTLQGKGFHCP